MSISALVGFIWGLMEGLWFFIIPDIGLSYVAIKGVKHATIAVITTILGAMLAAIIFYLGVPHITDSSQGLAMVFKFWSKLPGYYPAMLTKAEQDLIHDGARGLMNGPSSGIPYRFYLAGAYTQNISLLKVLLWTPIARLERILLAPLLVVIIKKVIHALNNKYKKFEAAHLDKALVLFITLYWIGIYTWYWGFFLPKEYGG